MIKIVTLSGGRDSTRLYHSYEEVKTNLISDTWFHLDNECMFKPYITQLQDDELVEEVDIDELKEMYPDDAICMESNGYRYLF